MLGLDTAILIPHVEKETDEPSLSTTDFVIDPLISPHSTSQETKNQSSGALAPTPLSSSSIPPRRKSEMNIARIQLTHLSKYFTSKDVRKWLFSYQDIQKQTWASTLKIKKSPHSPSAFVSLADETQFTEVYSFLSSQPLRCRNKTVLVSKAKEQTFKPVNKPLLLKRSNEDPPLSPLALISLQTTPLSTLPYEDQVKQKNENVKSILAKEFKQHVKDLPDFPMLPPIPSPLTQGYRTKCEFSFGLNHDREKCIGFNAGAYLSGDLAVVPPDGLKHVHENMILGCRILQEYIDQSPYPVWDKKVGAGFFRLCLMRTSTLHENMFILQVDPMNLSDSELQSFETEFKAFFIQGAAKLDLRITVLGIQYYKGVHDQFSPIEPIHALVGDSLLIHETLLGCTFTISPTSFFQVNTGAAEQLYQVVQSWTSSSPQATLLDLCCGTGTIGICLASGFHQVIGIEIIDSAIQDAKKNALANQIDTIRFELGSVESVLPKLLKVIDGEMVAVLNPPRNGVHSSVIRAIRACKSIQKLVYISCNVKLASKNFIDLCRPESLSTQGTPFKVTRSVIVDMFPHTHHVETVIEFERTLQS